MIEFLSTYSDIITLLFTVIVGLSTLVYAILTAKLVKETKLLRKAQTDPEIFISLIHNENSISFIDLKVENIGLGPAYEIEFNVIKDFKLLKRNLSEVGFIKNGIRYFSPKQKLQLFVASFIDDPEGLSNKEIELEVKYKNSIGQFMVRRFLLSFGEYSSFTQVGSPPLHKIANNLEKIKTSFDSVISGFKKLQVDTYNNSDRIEKEKRIEEEQ